MNHFIAHRGLHTSEIKENTLKSFLAAIKSPFFNGFECDIRTTKDNTLVIVHDAFIGKHLIRNTNYATLKKKYSIPTLKEVLELETDKIILLEIKELDLDINNFLNVINNYKKQNIYIMSFYNKVIKNLKRAGCVFPLGVLNYVFNSEEEYHDYDFIVLLESVLSNNLINYFKAQNIKIFVYGVHKLNESKQIYNNLYFIVDNIL